MFKILNLTQNNLIAFQVKGKVTKEDYDRLTPLLEKTSREHDTKKLYVEIENIQGIEPSALWEDLKAYFQHYKDYDRIAIVSDGKVIEILTKAAKPFVSGEVRFFRDPDLLRARQWVMD